MKIAKIILGMAAVTALAFTSCKFANGTLGSKGIIDYSTKKDDTTKAEATAFIDYTNSTDDFKRGMRLFNNKKKGIVTNLVIDNLVQLNSNPGAIGVVFNLSKNSNGTYNFLLLGMMNTKAEKAQVYIEQYQNIKESDFSADQFGAVEVGKISPSGTYKNPTTGEQEAVKNSKDVNLKDFDFACAKEIQAFKTYDDAKAEIDHLSVGVCIKALKNGELEEGDGYDEKDVTNAYKIIWYDTNDVTDVTVLGTTDKPSERNRLDTITISRAMIGDDSTKTLEGKMGFYANVYSKQTLTAEWQVADIKHNPHTPFWADEDGSRIGFAISSVAGGIKLR